MSMIACDKCESYIDSDEDPDCFIEHLGTKFPDTVACESCRERMGEEQDRQDHFMGIHESQAGV